MVYENINYEFDSNMFLKDKNENLFYIRIKVYNNIFKILNKKNNLDLSYSLCKLVIFYDKEFIKILNYNFIIYSNSFKINRELFQILRTRTIILNSIEKYFKFNNYLNKSILSKVIFIQDKKHLLKFACKIIKLKNDQDYENILREIELLRNLNSSNIIKLKNSFLNNNKLFLIFNLYKTIDNFNNLRYYKNFIIICLRVIKGIVNGLVELKINNIVHRDWSIHNILFKRIDENMTELDVIINDFDWCQYINIKEKDYIDCKGFPGFIDPNLLKKSRIVLNNENINNIYGIDIYSLGCIFYYLITNDLFYNKYKKENYILILNRSFDKYDIKMEFRKEIIKLFENMIEKDFNKRIKINNLMNHNLFNFIYD